MIKNHIKNWEKMIMTWFFMWLNWSIATINAMLQLLEIYIYIDFYNAIG